MSGNVFSAFRSLLHSIYSGEGKIVLGCHFLVCPSISINDGKTLSIVAEDFWSECYLAFQNHTAALSFCKFSLSDCTLLVSLCALNQKTVPRIQCERYVISPVKSVEPKKGAIHQGVVCLLQYPVYQNKSEDTEHGVYLHEEVQPYRTFIIWIFPTTT